MFIVMEEIALPFFGLSALMFFIQSFNRQPALIIDDSGITYRGLPDGKIAWGDIVDMQIISKKKGNKFKTAWIGFKLASAEAKLKRAGIDMPMEDYPSKIPVFNLDRSPRQICVLLMEKLEESRTKYLEIIP
jgi:hypothetical protein